MLWLLLLIPIAWAIAARLTFSRYISVKEMFIQMGITVFVTFCAFVLASMYDIRDTKYVHGHVTKKYSEKVSCEHSYSCNCRTTCSGSGSNRSCSTHCDTCYEHFYDVDWIVKATVGYSVINRVNRQGTKEPPRFTAAFVNEPYTAPKSFTNYVAAANQSLFYRNTKDKNWKYPRVYDYYKFDQVIVDGNVKIDLKAWNKDFAKFSSTVTNGSNVMLVITDKSDLNGFVEHIKGVWKTGKINDVIIVAQADAQNKIIGLRAFTYANDKNNELLVIKLRDQLIHMPLDNLVIVDIIFNTTNEFFKETSPKEFEYLKHSIQMSTASMIFLTIVILIANIGVTIFMIKQDLDNL